MPSAVPRILSAMRQEPWLIQPEFLDVMIDIAERVNVFDPNALQKKWGTVQDGARRATRRGPVAILPVHGPLIKYADMFSEISGATSYSTLAKDLETVKDDESVTHVILDVDSPGGMANGCQELAAMIREVNDVKPVIAYTGGTCASAAYWLASAADRIVAGPTAMIGSIGVVISGMDTRGVYEKAGAKFFKIVSSQSPKKQPDPTNEKGLAQIQTLVDGLADLFVQAVAEHRDVSVDTVLKTFGKGDVMLAQAAMEAGMIDSIGSLERLIAELSSEEDEPKARGFAAAANSEMEVQMNLSELKQKDPDGYAALMAEAAQASQAQHESVLKEKDSTIARLSAQADDATKLSKSMEARLASLEKENALRAERELGLQAQNILTSQLAASGLPERVQSKIRLDYSPFVKDGKLDADAFGQAVAAEIADWETALGESLPSVMGASSVVSGCAGARKEVASPAKPSFDADAEAERWAKLAGVELKKED